MSGSPHEVGTMITPAGTAGNASLANRSLPELSPRSGYGTIVTQLFREHLRTVRPDDGCLAPGACRNARAPIPIEPRRSGHDYIHIRLSNRSRNAQLLRQVRGMRLPRLCLVGGNRHFRTRDSRTHRRMRLTLRMARSCAENPHDVVTRYPDRDNVEVSR